nr:MAG: hypothetical protein H2BulkLitter113459_000001 [Mitovirus sp.]QDH88187.1 MAG: hypothetical protein H3Bulk404077_000003 [Mitovirus sp.]QDH89107.1 MAG: hypothetical protein H2RhizoLitter83761_000002 [Mitovirus sp.]QDH91257.1 MAG: hypothetical protein H1Bulk30552_000001 [Mitovirus sp.]
MAYHDFWVSPLPRIQNAYFIKIYLHLNEVALIVLLLSISHYS